MNTRADGKLLSSSVRNSNNNIIYYYYNIGIRLSRDFHCPGSSYAVRERARAHAKHRGRRHILKRIPPLPTRPADGSSDRYRTRSDGGGYDGGGGGGDGGCCRCRDNWIGAQECGESLEDRPTARRTIKRRRRRRRLFGNVAGRQVTPRGWSAHNRSAGD